MIRAWIALLLLPLTLRAPVLAWDASVSATGYYVFQGSFPGTYDFVQDVGNVTTNRVNGLEAGQTYCFAVSAYNALGESALSEEVSFTMPSITTNSILRIFSASDPVLGPWSSEIAVTNLFTGRKFFRWTLGFETNRP